MFKYFQNEFKKQLQTKLEYAHLLTSSLQDIPLKKGGSGSTIQDFQVFMEKVIGCFKLYHEPKYNL